MKPSLALLAIAVSILPLGCRSSSSFEPTTARKRPPIGTWESTDRANSFIAVLGINPDGCHHYMVSAVDGRYKVSADQLTFYDPHGAPTQQATLSIRSHSLTLIRDDGTSFLADRFTPSSNDSLTGTWRSQDQFALIQGYLRFQSDGVFSYRVQMPSVDLMPCRIEEDRVDFDDATNTSLQATQVGGTLRLHSSTAPGHDFVRADWYPLLTAAEIDALAHSLRRDGGLPDIRFPHL